MTWPCHDVNMESGPCVSAAGAPFSPLPHGVKIKLWCLRGLPDPRQGKWSIVHAHLFFLPQTTWPLGSHQPRHFLTKDKDGQPQLWPCACLRGLGSQSQASLHCTGLLVAQGTRTSWVRWLSVQRNSGTQGKANRTIQGSSSCYVTPSTSS
jgi:hypothetical protein